MTGRNYQSDAAIIVLMMTHLRLYEKKNRSCIFEKKSDK